MPVNMGTAVAYLDMDLTGFNAGMAKASSAWTLLKSDTASAGTKIQTVGAGINSVGKAMTLGFTLPLVGAGVAALKSSIDFESAFAGVRKTVDTTESNFDLLRTGVLEMSKVMPTSASEIAGVMEIAGQLGVKVGESGKDILDFTKIMVMLGDTTDMSSEEAATAIARFMNITGTLPENVSRVGSTIVDLGNKFATTEREITEMSQRLAAGGKLAGLTEPQILALAAAMSSVGIEAEAGGTAMTQTFNEIEKAVAKGGDQLETFASVSGMSSDDFAEAWENDPMTVLSNFIKGLGELDESGGSAVLTLEALGLTGIRQSNMLKSLGLANEMMTDAIDVANEAWDENNALQIEANKRYETTESKLKMLKNDVIELGIKFGDILIPYLQKFVDWLGKIADYLSSLDEETRKTIINVGLVVAALGPVLMFIGKMVGAVGTLVNLFSATATAAPAAGAAIGAMSGPIGWILLAIAAVVAGFVAFYKTNEQFKQGVDETWSMIKEKFAGIGEALKEPFGKLGESFKKLWETAKEFFAPLIDFIEVEFVAAVVLVSGIISGIVDSIGPLIDIITETVNIVTEFMALLMSFVSGDMEAVEEHLGNIGESILGIFDGVYRFFKEGITGFAEGFESSLNSFLESYGTGLHFSFEEMFDVIGQFFVNIWESVKTFFVNMWQSVVDWFSTAVSDVSNFFTSIWDSIVDGFNGFIEGIKKFFTEDIPAAFDALLQFFEDLPYNIGYAIGYVLQTLENWRQDVINWITTKVPEIIESVVKWFAELPGKIGEWLQSTWDKFIEWGTNLVTKASETGAAFLQSIIDWFQQLPTKIAEWFDGVLQKADEWKTDAVNKAKSTGSDFVNGIIDWIKTLPAKFKEWFDAVKTTLGNISLKQIGKDILNSLWEGLKSIWKSISSWFEGIAESISNFVSGIREGMSDARSVSGGSYASGLDYVPRDMLVQVHEGERIITKEQNRNSSGSPNFEININLIGANINSEIGIKRTSELLGEALSYEIRALGVDII